MEVSRRRFIQGFILLGGGSLTACDTLQGRLFPKQGANPSAAPSRSVEIQLPPIPRPALEIVNSQLRTRPSPIDLGQLPAIARSAIKEEHDQESWRYLKSLKRPNNPMVVSFLNFSETKQTFKNPNGATTSYLTKRYDVSRPAKGGPEVIYLIEYQTSENNPDYWYSGTAFKIGSDGKIINYHLRQPELIIQQMEPLLPKVFDVPSNEWYMADINGSFNSLGYQADGKNVREEIIFRKDGVVFVHRSSLKG